MIRIGQAIAITKILGIVAVAGVFFYQMHQVKVANEKLWAKVQEQTGQFEKLKENIAQANVKVVEKHYLKTIVKHDSDPELRKKIDELKATVDGVAQGQIQVADLIGSGQGEQISDHQWELNEPDKLWVKFTLPEAKFDYKIYGPEIDFRITQTSETHDGVNNIKRWWLEAYDKNNPKTVYKVKKFQVEMPNLYKKKEKWWQKKPTIFLSGSAVMFLILH